MPEIKIAGVQLAENASGTPLIKSLTNAGNSGVYEIKQIIKSVGKFNSLPRALGEAGWDTIDSWVTDEEYISQADGSRYTVWYHWRIVRQRGTDVRVAFAVEETEKSVFIPDDLDAELYAAFGAKYTSILKGMGDPIFPSDQQYKEYNLPSSKEV